MKVWLASIGPDEEVSAVGAFRALAQTAASSRHTLAGSPADADLVLFTDCHLVPHDPGLRAIRSHPLLREFPERSLVYDERDLPWPAWPGVYVSMPRRQLRPEFQEPWAYHSIPVAPPVEMDTSRPPEPELLFSFVGSLSHRVRRDVVALGGDRAEIEDVGRFTFYDLDDPSFVQRRARYQEILLRSKFVLCPRGKGTSSIRLYETLAAGRVPVIIADDWVEPNGPEWASCSLRWPESAVAKLPEALAAREADFNAMSNAALQTYAEWFSPSRSFERIVDACGRLLERRAPERFPRRGVRGRAYARAHLDHARWCTREHLVHSARRLRFPVGAP
jgi:hypothetical protein